MAEKVRMQDFGAAHRFRYHGVVGGGGAEGQGEQKAVQHLLNAGELGWETCCQWIPVWAHWRAVQGSGQPSLILTA